MADRQELLHNAVAFLSDPKTQSSPLTQRIQFLEAKGLTPHEIDFALKQTTSHGNTTAYPPQFGALAGQVLPWDWRDYFITGIVSGTIAYGTVALFKKFLWPHLQPPKTTAYEDDRNVLTAQFDAAETLLKEIQAESAAVKVAVEKQGAQIEKATVEVDAVAKEMREGEVKTRDEIREVREEVNNIREMLPKMIEKNKDHQIQSLGELQQELKSLKALLLSRGPTMTPPGTGIPALGKPTIPAWQLGSNGKGKEPERNTT